MVKLLFFAASSETRKEDAGGEVLKQPSTWPINELIMIMDVLQASRRRIPGVDALQMKTGRQKHLDGSNGTASTASRLYRPHHRRSNG